MFSAPGLLKNLRRDYLRQGRSLRDAGLWALAVYRYGVWSRQLPQPARWMTSKIYGGLVMALQLSTGTQIYRETRIGEDLHLVHGLNVLIHPDVVIGDRVKLENNVSLFKGARIASGAFIGPHTCLLNDKRPRAITPQGALKASEDWTMSGVTVGEGASIGGGCTVLPGVTVGSFALVGAGAVVTKDVPPHGLVVGNPARLIGFVCECGERLDADGTCIVCARLHLIGNHRPAVVHS